jgi:hypothetical protein
MMLGLLGSRVADLVCTQYARVRAGASWGFRND